MKHLTLDGSRHLTITFLIFALLLPGMAFAGTGIQLQDFTRHWASWLAVGIFLVAYLVVIAEEAFIDANRNRPWSRPDSCGSSWPWSTSATVTHTRPNWR